MNNIFAYKTSVLGVLAFLGALVPALTEFFSTGTVTMATIGVLITAFMAMIGLGVARDYNSSDKNEGLK